MAQADDIEAIKNKLNKLLSHIENVRQLCIKLGFKLIETGEVNVGIRLIAQAQNHDVSKFFGIEFDHLFDEDTTTDVFKEAVSQHIHINRHHAEYHGDISHMSRVDICELVCDWLGRANEFGEAIDDWVDGKAMKKYKFKKNSKVYKDIKYLLQLLLEPAFV